MMRYIYCYYYNDDTFITCWKALLLALLIVIYITRLRIGTLMPLLLVLLIDYLLLRAAMFVIIVVTLPDVVDAIVVVVTVGVDCYYAH